ncbi:MAG TPA: hypothetical protein VF120_14225 [Ktedonobacterales bacterium]
MGRGQNVATSRYCHLCGRLLAGRYLRYESGLTVCGSCEATRPRCARCGVPLSDAAIASAHRSGNPALCGDCLRSAQRCSACQQPLLGVFYTFENLLGPGPAENQRGGQTTGKGSIQGISQERKFCARCVQHRPRCDLCSAPVAEGSTPVADGQWRCEICSAELVLGEDGVRAVYRMATALFATTVDSALRETPQLEVVSRRELSALRQRYSRGTNGSRQDGDGHHVLGYFVSSHGRTTIYVERALPRPLLLGTLAHELGHAWQAEFAPGVRELLLSEGFAEWVAHRVLVAAGMQATAARATRRDDIYGRGLRHFLEIERLSGRGGVLAAIKGPGN